METKDINNIMKEIFKDENLCIIREALAQYKTDMKEEETNIYEIVFHKGIEIDGEKLRELIEDSMGVEIIEINHYI